MRCWLGARSSSVRPEHGPGAVVRNARKRYAELASRSPRSDQSSGREVEVRDLAIYEQLLAVDLREAA